MLSIITPIYFGGGNSELYEADVFRISIID